jgi:hypothetical protein
MQLVFAAFESVEHNPRAYMGEHQQFYRAISNPH